MEQIIKIMDNLPEEVVRHHILPYLFDKQGYTALERKRIEKIKRKNDFKHKRIIAELKLFNTPTLYSGAGGDMTHLKINWGRYTNIKKKKFLNNLKNGKATTVYHTGLYLSMYHERNWIRELARIEKNNHLRQVNWRNIPEYGWRVTINRFIQNSVWQNVKKKIENKCIDLDNKKYKIKLKRRRENEMQMRWNQSMAAAANSIF